jgi:predicted Zn-dependent peptidase
VSRPALRRLLFLAALAGAALPAAPGAAQIVPGSPRFPFVRYRLGNGLEVILHEDHTVPQAYVSVWYHVGARDERPGKSGLAHFCEHMMFEGSRHVKPGEHFNVLGSVGNPDANATTSSERTNYFETVPAGELETALWLESDRMGYLRWSMDQARFENQREVVRNERRQRYENGAFGQEPFVVASALYPEGHPYRTLAIGSHEDIQAATLTDAREFFAKWYVPANASLLIAGDIDPAATKDLVQRWFGSLPGGPRPAHASAKAPVLTAPRRQVVTDPFTKVRRVHYVWPTPIKAYTDDDLAMDLVAFVLASPSTGRLQFKLTVQMPLALSVSASHSSRGLSSEFHVVVDLRPEASLAAVERVLQTEIARIAADPISERELRQAVSAAQVRLLTGAETLEARGETMQTYNHYRGDPDGFAWRISAARKATPASVRAVAERVLGEGRLEVITMPGAP